MRTTPQQFKTLIDDLIGATYDSGYYSGQGRDGEDLHRTAMARRNYLWNLALAAYDSLYADLMATYEEDSDAE